MPACRSSGAREALVIVYINSTRRWRSGPKMLIPINFYLHSLQLTCLLRD